MKYLRKESKYNQTGLFISKQKLNAGIHPIYQVMASKMYQADWEKYLQHFTLVKERYGKTNLM